MKRPTNAQLDKERDTWLHDDMERSLKHLRCRVENKKLRELVIGLITQVKLYSIEGMDPEDAKLAQELGFAI